MCLWSPVLIKKFSVLVFHSVRMADIALKARGRPHFFGPFSKTFSFKNQLSDKNFGKSYVNKVKHASG